MSRRKAALSGAAKETGGNARAGVCRSALSGPVRIRELILMVLERCGCFKKRCHTLKRTFSRIETDCSGARMEGWTS